VLMSMAVHYCAAQYSFLRTIACFRNKDHRWMDK